MSRNPRARKTTREEGKLRVVYSDGSNHPFLRGMVTHDLIQRGLEFDEAYAVAAAMRSRFGVRDEVSTAEIRDLVTAELEGRIGVARSPQTKGGPLRELRVIYHGQEQPFSRGLLARSIHAAGFDLDRAYQLVAELETSLFAEKVDVLPSDEIARRVGDLLERSGGTAIARRYRLVRRIHQLPRPLVIYVGGASGTGKSSLALELAPLLRIYRVNATDTIRQVMRMVFTPTMLPALHSSSFEVAQPYGRGAPQNQRGSPRDPVYVRRLIATFEEQATRVCVGVRAVVERAIAENMSILVEGVHLHPRIIPFTDLEGGAYQVPLLMTTLTSESHRTRFLARAKSGGRRSERYLESFDSIRIIHDHLLEQAEAHDMALVDTSRGDPYVEQALRLVTGILERRIPAFGRAAAPARPSAPSMLLIIDGLADRPVRALGGRTPLQAARTPTLDRLAREGRCGVADPIAPGVVPDTAAGSLALFGQSPLALKRGPAEAMGAGIALSPGDIALRGNFATLDENGQVLDRRAGRVRDEAAELAEALDRLSLPGGIAAEVDVLVRVGTEHRLAIVLRGDGLSSAIQGSDPGDGSAAGPPLTPRPLDPRDERAVHTAGILALFEQEARLVLARHPLNLRRAEQGLLAANAVLTRGAGRTHRLIPLEDRGMPLRLTCISGDRTILGLAKLLGAESITSEAMTANLDTDLSAKFDAALQALGRSDLVFLHVKGADIAAHDRRPDQKVSFLERLDVELGRLLRSREGSLRVAVASDHATLSEIGQHAADPVPVLLWGDGIDADSIESFDEYSAATGALRRFPLQMLLGRLFDLS